MSSLLVDGRTLGERAVTRAARNPATVISAVVMPLLFFGLFNLVMRRIMDARGFDYAQLLPSTVVVQAMLFSAMSSAYYIADDVGSGIVGRFRSMPIHPAAPLVGRAVGDVVRAFFSLIVVVIFGMLFGMRFDAGLVWIPAYIGVGVLFALSASLVMGLIGYGASSPEAAVSIATIPYLPLLMLSTGFAPAEDFPGWLRPFIENQPITATIDALRALSGDGDIAPTVTRALAWSIGLTIVFLALGARRFRKVTS
ncbi:MAG: ABC transporter permease [Actinomycetota bacterium]